MNYKNHEDGYESDFSTGRTEIDGDTVIYLKASEASVDGEGGTIRGKPVFTIDEASYYLNRGDGLITYEGQVYESGAEWYGAQGTATNDYYNLAVSKADGDGTLNTLSFGFYETQATLPEPYIIRLPSGQVIAGMGQTAGFSAFSAAQRVATREAISVWDDLISVTFKETHFSQGDLNFMNTTTGPIQASAYLPYNYGSLTYTNGSPVVNQNGKVVTYAEISGDVYVNPNQASNQLFDEGQYGLTTLIHEIGHSLGLEHPGNYNFSANFTATYINGAEYYQDSNQYTIMSYWDALETGAQHVDWTNLTYRYASTPGVHDVAAIQRIYGADMTTRTGDTTYGFNSNAGNESFDFGKTPAPVVTIWDAGGNDTLDLSGYKTPSLINLNPGSFSSAGGTLEFLTLAQINANRALEGSAPRTQATLDLYNQLFKDPAGLTNGLMKDNIGIAYGATIENATGGAGDDVIIGNSVNNVLKGGAGNDVLVGGNGVDRLTGGAGSDIFVAEVTAAKTASKMGPLSVDIITDFQRGSDLIDLGGIDANAGQSGHQSFAYGPGNGGVGQVWARNFGNINAAESALGFDIDGLETGGQKSGPVTVLFGDTNGGSPDFALVLLDTKGVGMADLLFAPSQYQALNTADQMAVI